MEELLQPSSLVQYPGPLNILVCGRNILKNNFEVPIRATGVSSIVVNLA